MEFTKEQRRLVDAARNAFHRAVMAVLTEAGVDYTTLDITEAGESIALEGYLEV
jgi:hypothetical protein